MIAKISSNPCLKDRTLARPIATSEFCLRVVRSLHGSANLCGAGSSGVRFSEHASPYLILSESDTNCGKYL